MTNKNQAPVDKNSREYLLQQYSSGRVTLVAVLLLTVINVVLMITGSDRYFLFSASVPYYLTAFGMAFDGSGIGTFTLTALVISAVILAVYLVCWLLAKKRPGWLTAALVLFIVDTAALLALSVWMDMLWVNILDLVFHVLAAVSLWQAVRASQKLKTMPEEMPVPQEEAHGTTPDLD